MNHPITKTSWIWPEVYMYLHNHFAQFRRDLELKTVPKQAVLHLTADKSYKLFVNGEYVCRGPARGYQSHWPFDTVDIKPFLRKGHNWISVEAYNPGISTFQYLHLTRAGLLCAPEGKELCAAWEKGKWVHRRSPAHSTNTARLSMQTDFQEHVDFSKDDRSWISSPKLPPNWQTRTFGIDQGALYLDAPFGRPPYLTVEERGIPLMREWLRGPKRVMRTAVGKSNPGYEKTENVSWFWSDELKKISKFQEAKKGESRSSAEALHLKIQPTGKGRYQAFFIDVGEYAAANLLVEIRGAKGGEILDFQYDQSDGQGSAQLIEPGQACLAAMSSRLRLAKGSNDHEFYQIIGFQHLTLIARDVTQPISVSISLRCAGYPFTFKGAFDCSDATLNEIREACRVTQQLCSFDAYVDTPWREQAQWWGDARVQARNTFYLDGDARLLARGIRSIAGQPGPQGLTYGHAPTSADSCILPDFALTWILSIWDHYYQTGDHSLIVEQWPRIEEVLSYFRSPEAVGKDGLLRYDPRFWLFEDWADLPKDRYPCFLNLWYLIALRRVAEMQKQFSIKAERDYGKLAREQEKRVVRHFYSRKQQVFLPVLDVDLRPSGEPSGHDQTMALMLGLVPESHDAMIEKVLLPFLKGESIKGAAPSAFWVFYVLEEMGRRGFGAEVIAYIRQRWQPMMGTGTTWEGFNSVKEKASTCHAWTAHPCVHFVNLLAGICQAAPAWKQILFKPTFVNGIDHAAATVPSPAGRIQASWRRKGGVVEGKLELPTGVQARIELPGQKAINQTGGVYRFRLEA